MQQLGIESSKIEHNSDPLDLPRIQVEAIPDVSIVIVNWNAGQLLFDCLASLHVGVDSTRSSVFEAIIVDNASADGSSVELLSRSDLVFVSNKTNRGFAAACNQGAAVAKGRYLLFLNPDCRVAAGAIEACRRTLESDPTVGVASVALTADDDRVSRSCHRFPSVKTFLFKLSGLSALSSRFPDGSMRDWPHDVDRRVDHVIGAFYMVRTDEFRVLGGFDERFFVYLEDLDLSLRYRATGKDCMFLGSVSSYHKGGGASEQAKPARLFYSTRSRILYAFKHFSAVQAWLHLLATITLEPLARIIERIGRGRISDIKEVATAFLMLYRDLPATLRRAQRS